METGLSWLHGRASGSDCIWHRGGALCLHTCALKLLDHSTRNYPRFTNLLGVFAFVVVGLGVLTYAVGDDLAPFAVVASVGSVATLILIHLYERRLQADARGDAPDKGLQDYLVALTALLALVAAVLAVLGV